MIYMKHQQDKVPIRIQSKILPAAVDFSVFFDLQIYWY